MGLFNFGSVAEPVIPGPTAHETPAAAPVPGTPAAPVTAPVGTPAPGTSTPTPGVSTIPNQDNQNPFEPPAKLNNEDGGSEPAKPANPATPANPGETFSNYISSLNFMDGVDLPTAMASFQEGKPEELNSAMNAIGANAFKQALLTVNQLLDKRLPQVIEQAVEQSTGKTNSAQAFKDMEAALPFTAKKEYSPIGKAVLTGFLRQGKSPPEAIAATGKYFEKFFRDAAAQGLDIIPPGTNINGNFGGGDRNNNGGGSGSSANSQGQTNWLEVLSAGS